MIGSGNPLRETLTCGENGVLVDVLANIDYLICNKHLI